MSFSLLAARRSEGQVHRILLAGTDTAGFLSCVEQEVHGMGLTAEGLYRKNAFGYGTGDGRKTRKAKSDNFTSPLRKIFSKHPWIRRLAKEAESFFFLFRAMPLINSSSAIIISGIPEGTGTAILLRACRDRRVRSLLVTHGTDSRPMYLDGTFAGSREFRSIKRFVAAIHAQKRRVSSIERDVDAILTWKGASAFFEREVFLFEDVGFPVELPLQNMALGETGNKNLWSRKELRIIHAPSQPAIKGSDHISRVLESLLHKGYRFDFQVFTGVSNDAILDQLPNFDLVVDQAFSDNLCGVLGREAGYFSKPTLVAGHSLSRVADGLRSLPPSFTCEPEEMEQTIAKLLSEPGKLKAAGQKQFAYNQEFSDPKKVVRRILSILFPEDSFGCRPEAQRVGDFHPGFGGYSDYSTLKKMLTAVVAFSGLPGLQLEDKPWLIEEILGFYSVTTNDS